MSTFVIFVKEERVLLSIINKKARFGEKTNVKTNILMIRK